MQKNQIMVDINIRQKKYYEISEEQSKKDYNLDEQNFVTRQWTKIRNKFIDFRIETGIEQDILNYHLNWIGDLTNDCVLDLGCNAGNPLSLTLAEKSFRYLGIDLSASAIRTLMEKITESGYKNADALAVDFLSDEFQSIYSSSFDIIYAKSVAHHFKFFDVFLEKCSNVLKPGGKVITFDPLNTFIPMKIMRFFFRPFQSDKDWEYPFNKNTFNEVNKIFKIKNILGITGKSKWAFPLYFIKSKSGLKLGRKYHEYDKLHANQINSRLWSCMQVAMCWEKK